MSERLLDWAVQLAVAEETAREMARVKAEKVKVELAPPKPVTRVVELKDRLVKAELTVFEAKAPGSLHELMLRSSDKEYSIMLVTDGILKLYKSWDEMQAVSQYLDTVAAFEENGEYILHVKDFSWLESAYAVVSVKKPMNFSNIFIKYDLYLV